jgi:hypothetical protein
MASRIADADIERRFEYHAPKTETRSMAHTGVRHLLRDAAIQINHNIPDGREKSLCMTKLEEAMFWANAALAREPVTTTYDQLDMPNLRALASQWRERAANIDKELTRQKGTQAPLDAQLVGERVQDICERDIWLECAQTLELELS